MEDWERWQQIDPVGSAADCPMSQTLRVCLIIEGVQHRQPHRLTHIWAFNDAGVSVQVLSLSKYEDDDEHS